VSTPQGTSDNSSRDLDTAILAALFSESPIGLHVMDTQLRIIRVNSAALLSEAFPARDFLGSTLMEILRAFKSAQADSLVAMVREVLATGIPKRDVLLTIRALREPHPEITVSVSWFRLADPQGRPLGVAAAILDVTDRYRAQGRLALLGRAGARIGTTLDLFQTAQELADATVPGFADAVTVDLLDPVLRGEAPEPGPHVEGLPLRRAGSASLNEEWAPRVPLAGEVSRFPAGTPYRQCMADLRPRLIGRLDMDGAWLDLDPIRSRLLRRAGVHSVMLVPMRARGLVLGLACFYRWQFQDGYEEDDLALAVQLAARTALCLDNARLHSRDLSAARILQLSLRPPEVPAHAAVETAHSYLLSGSGCAWFDVIPLSSARVALVAGDIAGQGVRTAAVMGELRAAVGALADLDLPPDELLDRLHDLVARLGGEAAVGTTCLYAVYDPVTRMCAMARAGHPAPLVARPDGRVRLVDIPPGPALGHGIAGHRTVERELPEGSILVLSNTALLPELDAESGQRRLDRVRSALTPATGPLQEACDAVLGILAPERPERDSVLLLARTRALGPDQVASWTLSREADVVPRSRRLAAAQLRAWGLDDLEYATSLVVSELVTNAVRYSDGPIGLRLIRDRALTCEVSDTSSTSPQLRQAADNDEGGRGLFIAAQLTQRWGTRPTRRGKTIWTEQALPPAAAEATDSGS